MSPRRHLALVAAVILLAPASSGAQKSRHPAPGVADRRRQEAVTTQAVPTIGVARKEADGTIVLTLRPDGGNGTLGDAEFRYPPSDKDYDRVSRHVGPIPDGKSVPVKPFADE